MDHTHKELEILINTVKSIRWSKSVGLIALTEGLIIAAQEQSLPICRLWEQKTKLTDHLVSGFPNLTTIKYKERHDKRGH